jgi:hypothetical protein
MSELDQLLKQDPDFLPLNDWKKDNDTGDEIKNRKNYADYVRGEYVSAGAYSDRIANEIAQSTLNSAVADGVIKADDQAAKEMLFTPDEPDLDTKLQTIQTNLDTTDPAWDAATKYLTFKKLNPDDAALPEDIRAKGEQYLVDAQSVADTGYRKAVKSAVRSGELPLAKVKNDEGEYEILVSPTAGAMNMAEAIRASKKGGVTFADASAVQSKLSTPIGFNEPIYKFERYTQAASMIEEYAKKDSHTSKIIQNYSEELAAADKDGRAPKSFDEYASSIRFELNKSGLIPEDDALSNEEVSKALTQIAYNNANTGGQFKLYDKPEEAYKNVRNVGFGTAFVHPAALVNDNLFSQSVTDNPNLSADQKKILEARREPALQQQFDSTNDLLSKSSKSDEWLNALQSGRVSGKKDTEILKEFVSNPDNFSEIQDRLAGVGKSIVDGVGEMAAAIPMMMGADWARDYMVGNLKERSNRREVARLFGAEYGIVQDVAESLAPMLADVAATGLLAAATAPAAGAGGAAFLAAKQGARLTAKGLLKGMTSSALRQLPTETAETAAERLVSQGLIKASTAEAGISGAQAAIKGFNSELAKTIGVTAATAVPAFNRSAGATYASVYATLENNKDLTPEEKHDRALGAGLAAGATTALITGAFGAFGRGGLEDALLSGASRKQIKNVVARLANVDDISDDVFNKVISKQVSETLKKYGTFDAAKGVGKEIFKNSVDEGAEEGLDEFVNGFISDAATDEDTPFLERLEQAGRAALIGGIIGGGVPAIKAVKNAVIQRDSVGVQIGVETEFARGVSDKLTQSGSPITAQTVYSILTAPRRARAPIAQAILDQSRQPAIADEVATEVDTEVEDIQTPTAEQITEALNNSTSPDTVAKTIVDERGQSQFAFVEDIPTTEVAKRGRTVRKPAGPTSPVAQQLEFDYTSKQDKKPQDQLDLGLDTSSPEKPKVKKTRTASSTKSIKKAKLAEQLGLDFDSASVDEQNNHINANYSDEDLTDQDKADLNAELAAEQLPTEERNRMLIELFGAIESQQTKAPTTKGKKATKNIPAQATAQPPILGAAIGAKEPMFSPDEFIDDEMIGQEVASLTRIATLGYPVRLERKALHGMPQRGTYPKGYLVGKSDMVARKISELYPVRVDKNAVEAETIVSKEKVSFYDPKVKSVVRRTPKASIDKSGVGIFNNDPVSMKLLLDRRIPVVIPDSFVSVLNPSFRTYTSGGVRFLNDIVMTNPETGTGFVSVLTKEDQVISSEPNYKYYANLSSFTALFNPEITSRSVPNPRGGSGEVTLDEITLDEIIQDADQLAAAASSGRPNSAYGDPEKARATLRVIVKPRKGTLETEFFEAAVPAFNMSVRKEAIIHELRLGMDKFSERKSGEATPTLKTDKIAAAIDDLVSRTKVDKDIAARNIAGIFGSDIDPETEPDLVLQKFIENEVLVRPPFMPTFREIGAKVGNAFAEQQRSRDIFSRKALFETTDPTDLAQIQDDTELFDPEAEAADNTFIAPTTPFEAPDSSLIGKALKEATFDAADALDSDPEMRSQIDRLLRRTVFKGNSAIDITKLSSTDAFGMLASWMSSGNYNTNPDAIKFQRDLRDGVYVSGDRMRRVMKMMYLSSKTIEGDPTKDVAYVESIRENLESSFGRSVSRQEASDYLKSIGNAIQPLWSRSYVRGEQIAYARQQNDAEVARLGLKTNDPESVIKALKTIASSEPDANKRLLAKLLLENQGYIRQVEFTLDESPLQYAGAYMKASNGSPMISVNLDGHNGRGLVDVLLHEYTHAFVSISVASPNENLNAAQRGSLQRINGILELARRSAADNGITDPTLTDGLENVNEFVTHFFTSTDFQGFLKALLPPAKQRGFFARMVDAVLDMFGLGRSKQSDYQKAFTDIVDLTKEAVLRAPMTPAGLINRIAGPASRTLNQVSEAAKAINDTIRPTQVAAEVETTAVEADIVAEQETESIIQEVTEQDIAPSVNSTAAETLAKVKDMIRMVRRMVPAEFELEIRTDLPYAAAFQGGKILLNPNAMSGVVAGLDDVSARGIVEGIMTEEAAHAASYNALTQQELDNYVATLKESDFDDVIDRYYQTDELKVAAKARIRSEDPTTAAREREGMAEELLRMHSQKVTRGFTTEEDYMFWRSKPSLLKIIGRYMKGFINRYMAGKSVATMNGTQRATLQRMITEVRAINAGYRLTPNTLEFDAQNPHATMAQIATQLGSKIEPTRIEVVPELTGENFEMFSSNDIIDIFRIIDSGGTVDSVEADDAEGGKVRSIAKLFHKQGKKNKIDWSANWKGRKKNFDAGQEEKFNKDVSDAAKQLMEYARIASRMYPNFQSWYEDRLNMAMNIFEELDPEVTNPENKFILRVLLAVTSNGNGVKDQTFDTWRVYQDWKTTKRLGNTEVSGTRKTTIKNALAQLDGFIANKGWEYMDGFLQTTGTVKELRDKLQSDFGMTEKQAEDITKGELIDERVPFSLIFGAKLGSFFNNLSGDFSTTTMDRWFMRTFGRAINSQLKEIPKKEVDRKRDALRNAISELATTKDGAAFLKGYKLTAKSRLTSASTKDLWKYFTKEANRKNLSKEMDNLRLTANAFYKISDGFELVEAPINGGHRRFIRAAMSQVLDQLRAETGKNWNPAEVQALLWYFEKATHEAYGSRQKDDAPDYGSATRELFRAERGGEEPVSFRPSDAVRRRSVIGDGLGGMAGRIQGPQPRLQPTQFGAGEGAESVASQVISIPRKYGTPIEIHKINSIYDADGNRANDLSKLISSVQDKASKVDGKVYGKKFLVIVDGDRKEISTISALNNYLSGITGDEGVRVFKNGNNQIAINYDWQYDTALLPEEQAEAKKQFQDLTQRRTLATQFGSESQIGILAFKQKIKDSGFEYLVYRDVIEEGGGVEEWDRRGGLTIDARRYPTAIIGDTKVAFTTEGLYLDRGKVQASYESDTDQNGNTIYTISRVFTDPKSRGAGQASRAITIITDAADKSGLTLQLEPEVISTLTKKGEKSLTKKQLVDWYKKNGFVQKFSGSDNILIREPNVAGSMRPTQFGAASAMPARFEPLAIDYSNFLESLEMPMMEIGTYQSPKGMLDKLLKGELDPRILRLKNQRDFFNKATFDLAERYKTKLDAIIKRDFGGIENAPVDLIQDATGSTKGLALPEDVLTQIEDDFNYDLDVNDTDDTLTAEDKRIANGIAMMRRDKAILDAEKTLADSIRTRRDDALGQLATQSPDLVKHIVQLRTLTDEMSKKVASLYGFPPELKAKFDNQLGIYLTRTYKMFDEIGFGEKVLNDPYYEDVRDAAINFFEKQFIDSEVRRRISGANGVPRAQAEAEAKRELGLKTMGGRTYGQLMMEEFINSYDKTGKAISATNMSRQLKPLLDNVQLKRDLPKEIRDLLGEKGAETGVDNLIRSLITTGSMAANQSFLNNVRDIGRAGGWLITATELADGKKKDYDTFGKYKSIRETTSSYDPLGELYGPPEMVDAFRKVFSPDGIRFNQTAAQEVVGKTIGVAARLSGAAMAAKTLGSIGFYVRNVVSNALFFAPAQGFVNFKSMATKAYDEVWSNAIVDPTKIDSYRTKLISLGVIGDDINTNIMAAMLRGGNSVDDIETKLGELIDTAKKGTKPLQWLSQRAQVLSGSVDAFYKIAYYENELRVLKEARSVDTGTLASASDSQLERMAADKVLATAQSSSQAPPLVQEVTKSGIGLLFAPFLRFKVEVPRIVLNTYKTAMAEMKSSNPVLKQRGITRFAGMTAMLSGVSAIVPAIASAVAGIGEDEDEALRSSVPEYLRNHTFFYRRKADGQLQSWDFTFLNPFSILADPTMRSMEQLFRGNPAKAAAKFVETAIFDQYLDDQILSSAVQSLRDNENPSTKKPIYEEKLDNAGIVLLKSLGFLFKEAYQPSVMKRAIESYQAVGADYTEFDDSPAGILMREFYPVKRHDIELDKQLRNYLADTRDVFNRVSERKNALFGKKAMETDSVKDIIQSEIEDKAKINEDIYKKLRGFEGLGLSPQQLYQITTGMGYGKDRTRLLFNKIMDRPVLNPEFIKRLSDPENEQGAERLKAALEVLQGTPRYIMLEP